MRNAPDSNRSRICLTFAVVVAFAAIAVASPAADRMQKSEGAAKDEVEVGLDMKEVDIRAAVRTLAELGDFQAVFDRDISCRLTVKFQAVPLEKALDTILSACGLDREGEGRVFRIAPRTRLTEEAEAHRKLDEVRAASAPKRMIVRRLNYARAEELAPLVKKLLSERGEVVVDHRTNTLFIID